MKKSRVAAVNSKPSPKPNPRWGREEETEIFAKNVRLFRQGKISDDDFRRFRLQHGAYGSRLRMDYSMIRIKVPGGEDRKSTRLNSSHANISYAVFCLKKKLMPQSQIPHSNAEDTNA